MLSLERNSLPIKQLHSLEKSFVFSEVVVILYQVGSLVAASNKISLLCVSLQLSRLQEPGERLLVRVLPLFWAISVNS